LSCAASWRTVKSFSLPCVLKKAHNNLSLPCVGARQTIFRQFYKIHKEYQINFKKIRKLTQI
jgi:hypothetical protein